MSPGGPRVEAYSGTASVQWAPAGGDMAALNTVVVTLGGSGPRLFDHAPGARDLIPYRAAARGWSAGRAPPPQHQPRNQPQERVPVMAFTDSSLVDPTLDLPINGKTYRIPSPSAEVGLYLFELAQQPDDAPVLDDRSEREFYARLLGQPLLDEMIADGVSFATLARPAAPCPPGSSTASTPPRRFGTRARRPQKYRRRRRTGGPARARDGPRNEAGLARWYDVPKPQPRGTSPT